MAQRALDGRDALQVPDGFVGVPGNPARNAADADRGDRHRAWGSALFLAHIGGILGGIRIVTVDIDNTNRAAELPRHDSITYITGSSTDPAIVATVRSHIRPDDRVMVILDSDHAESHVRAEMEVYGPLVTEGCFLIVEDSNVNGHPVRPDHGPGPLEAIMTFLPEHAEFQADRAREKFLLTANPSGYLRKVSG